MNADKEVCKPFNYMASPGPLSKHSKGPEAQLGEKVSMSMLMSLGPAHQALHAPWEWRGERLSSCFPEWRFRMQKHATSVYWKRLMGRGPHHEGNGRLHAHECEIPAQCSQDPQGCQTSEVQVQGVKEICSKSGYAMNFCLMISLFKFCEHLF